jgi:hypothetical protein
VAGDGNPVGPNPACTGVRSSRGCHSPSAVFLFAREDYELELQLVAGEHVLDQPSQDGSSSEASFTKPACKRSSCVSDMASRSTPGVASGGRTLCSHRRRISAARGSVTAFSRKPRSISASLGASRVRRVARA